MSRGGAGAQEPGGRASPGKPRALRSSSSRSSDGPKSGRPPWCLQHLHAVPGTTNSRVEGESAPEGERARAERGMRGRRPRRGRRSGGPRRGGRRRRARAGPSAEPRAPSPGSAALPQVRGPAGQGALDLVPGSGQGTSVSFSLLEGRESGVRTPRAWWRKPARQGTSTEPAPDRSRHGSAGYLGHTPHLQLSAASCGRSWQEWVARAAPRIQAAKTEGRDRTQRSGSDIFEPT